MFPWNYGFEWNAGHIIFLGAFYTVLVVVATTVISAMWRARHDLAGHHADDIRWHSDFHDLPPQDRVCRHVLTGEFRRRECPNAFDCRGCQTHAQLMARHPVAPPVGQTVDLCGLPTQATEGDGLRHSFGEEEILGMAFPLDRFYHRGHAWARPEADGSVTIGLDELGSRLAGKPDSIELPRPGTQIRVNGPAFRLRNRNAGIRVLAPVDGEVIETGSLELGWLLKVKLAGAGEPAFRHLLRGAEIRPWLLREMERLQLALTAEGAGPALADGGVPVADMAEACPHADWDAVCGAMFLEP